MTHGGKRKGAGRKAGPAGKLKVKGFALSQEAIEAIDNRREYASASQYVNAAILAFSAKAAEPRDPK